eukprot:jgi/Tetstr1/456414/TSEL_043148.t1
MASTAAANARAKPAPAFFRAPDTPTQDCVDALDLLDTAHRTLKAVGNADEARLTYLRRFKAKKALTPEEQVAERLIYSIVFDTAEYERSANVVNGLVAALEDKRVEVGLAAAATAHATTTFMRQASERDTDCDGRKMTRRRARDPVQKLRKSCAAPTFVAPRWEGKVWHHALTEMAVAERVVMPRLDLFRPGWRAGRDMPGAPLWEISIFPVSFSPDCTCAAAQ